MCLIRICKLKHSKPLKQTRTLRIEFSKIRFIEKLTSNLPKRFELTGRTVLKWRKIILHFSGWMKPAIVLSAEYQDYRWKVAHYVKREQCQSNQPSNGPRLSFIFLQFGLHKNQTSWPLFLSFAKNAIIRQLSHVMMTARKKKKIIKRRRATGQKTFGCGPTPHVADHITVRSAFVFFCCSHRMDRPPQEHKNSDRLGN